MFLFIVLWGKINLIVIGFVAFPASAPSSNQRRLFLEESAGEVIFVRTGRVWNFQDIFDCFYFVEENLMFLFDLQLICSHLVVKIPVIFDDVLNF
jgi:hypothetical protein